MPDERVRRQVAAHADPGGAEAPPAVGLAHGLGEGQPRAAAPVMGQRHVDPADLARGLPFELQPPRRLAGEDRARGLSFDPEPAPEPKLARGNSPDTGANQRASRSGRAIASRTSPGGWRAAITDSVTLRTGPPAFRPARIRGRS